MALWPGSGAIWMAGCGNMGGALLRCWLDAGLEPDRVTVIDPAPRRIDGVNWRATAPEGEPELFILGVKPQIIAEAAQSLARHVGPTTRLLSMLAGTEVESLRSHFPHAARIIRCMPNLPVMLGKGVTGLFCLEGPDEDVSALFAPTGHVEWLANEDQFHAVVAVSGSGPAFVYRYVAATAKAGAALGLPREQALRLAKAMTEGAAALCMASSDSPDELAAKVASPGGTTAVGLGVLDADMALEKLLDETLRETARRSAELSQA